ncbi:MAG: helix-turn-helix transcriptional regulator [Planctomycetaceae bacterium]
MSFALQPSAVFRFAMRANRFIRPSDIFEISTGFIIGQSGGFKQIHGHPFRVSYVYILFTMPDNVNQILTRKGEFPKISDMGKTRVDDPAMGRVRDRFEKSGMTQQELGERMGYPPRSARQAVSQFLRSGDPQISMLRRFADAVGVSLKKLICG